MLYSTLTVSILNFASYLCKEDYLNPSDNSLIVIGRVSKLMEYTCTSQNNPYNLPEDNDYILVDLDKIDYVIGFQGEEMIFRNYLF
jgi:hypothetical protein